VFRHRDAIIGELPNHTNTRSTRLHMHIHKHADLLYLLLNAGQFYWAQKLVNVFSFQRLDIPPPPKRARVSLLSTLHDHTQTHTTVGRTPLDEGSARRRYLYLTTQTLYKTNIHVPGGIRTHNPSKRFAADLRPRPRGRWDRLGNVLIIIIFAGWINFLF
jgi:hypothetical protein